MFNFVVLAVGELEQFVLWIMLNHCLNRGLVTINLLVLLDRS